MQFKCEIIVLSVIIVKRSHTRQYIIETLKLQWGRKPGDIVNSNTVNSSLLFRQRGKSTEK